MTPKNFSPLGLVAASTLLTLAACGTGAAAKVVQPDAPTANQALGSTQAACSNPKGPDSPLVIDMAPEQRAELEIAMSKNVAVVAYDCKVLKILRGCHVDGEYAYFATSLQEKTVRLTSADEIGVNLPLGGVALVGKIGAQMRAGTTLDLGLLMVGARRTTWGAVTPSDLKGSCSGATHFIAGAFVGAFSMQQGSSGSVATTAALFGVGASGASESSRAVGSKVGDPDVCNKASLGDKDPPGKCSTPIRLELLPVEATDGAGPSKTTGAAPAKLDTDTCPDGYVFTAGKCALSSATAVFTCDRAKPAECETQCTNGDPTSCGYAAQDTRARPDPAAKTKALAFAKKGCDAHDGMSCFLLGDMTALGEGTTSDLAQGTKLVEQSCDLGSSEGCGQVGYNYMGHNGVAPEAPKALLFYKRACAGGRQQSCNNAGVLLMGSHDGVTEDLATAASLFRRACDGGELMGCVNHGIFLRDGRGGIAQDKAAALVSFKKGCSRDAQHGLGCRLAAQLVESGGPGVPKDAAAAEPLFQHACELGDATSCSRTPATPPH